MNLGPTCQLIKGSERRVPQHFRKEKLGEKDENGNLVVPEKGSQVSAKFAPIPDIASSNSKFLTSVVHAAAKTGKYTVFDNKIVKAVVEHKWSTYIHSLFLRHMKIYIAMVVFLSADALIYRSVINAKSSSTVQMVLCHFPMAATSLLWTFLARHEIGQISRARSVQEHISDIWNFLDVASLSCIFIGYILRVLELTLNYSDTSLSTTILAVALPITYLNTIYYMQGFDQSGALVCIIIGIISGVRDFIGILSVCMVGFALSF